MILGGEIKIINPPGNKNVPSTQIELFIFYALNYS